MFFFIAGIQPRTRTLDEGLKQCPGCGRFSARIRRVDHYVSLFFIPLFPVSRGEPLLACERCGFSEPLAALGSDEAAPRGAPPVCPSCGHPLEPGYRYCPGCGRRL